MEIRPPEFAVIRTKCPDPSFFFPKCLCKLNFVLVVDCLSSLLISSSVIAVQWQTGAQVATSISSQHDISQLQSGKAGALDEVSQEESEPDQNAER